MTMTVAAAPVALSPYQKKVADVRGLLEKAKGQIKIALPKHLDADRLLRIALTSIQKTPALLDCDQKSLLACIIQAAQLGLEPDGVLGHAYLVPYGKTVTLIPGYRGLVDLARRSGQLSTIGAYVVHERDRFVATFGTDPKVEHVPYMGDEDPGQPTHVYAVAKLKDGGIQFVVMSKREVSAIKTRSKASASGPWKTDEEEMWKKTAIRRLCKLLPMSVEMVRAEALDEAADHGIGQDMGEIIDVTAEQERPANTSDLVPAGA